MNRPFAALPRVTLLTVPQSFLRLIYRLVFSQLRHEALVRIYAESPLLHYRVRLSEEHHRRLYTLIHRESRAERISQRQNRARRLISNELTSAKARTFPSYMPEPAQRISRFRRYRARGPDRSSSVPRQ